LNLLLELVLGRGPLNDFFQDGAAVRLGVGTVTVIVGLLQDGDACVFRDARDQLFSDGAKEGYNVSGRAFTDSIRSTFDLLDLPVPLRPMRAYRWPALSRSVASDKISRPVLRLAALPLAFVAPAGGPAETIMFKPSTSSCDEVSIFPFHFLLLLLNRGITSR
jgi:hypothetical protein